MQCPIDQAELVMTERQGVEIDYCPKCRGVWLDRGELDKVIERSAQTQIAAPSQPVNQPLDQVAPPRDNYSYPPRGREYEQRGREEDHRGYDHGKKHKKEGFLGDLFDF